MKSLAFIAVAALLSTPALAASPDAYRGSGQRAGGPAYLLNSETGGSVAQVKRRSTHPAYAGSGQRAGGPAFRLNSETGGRAVPSRSIARELGIPAYQLGSGQRAGGPAAELIR